MYFQILLKSTYLFGALLNKMQSAPYVIFMIHWSGVCLFSQKLIYILLGMVLYTFNFQCEYDLAHGNTICDSSSSSIPKSCFMWSMAFLHPLCASCDTIDRLRNPWGRRSKISIVTGTPSDFNILAIVTSSSKQKSYSTVWKRMKL